MNRLMVYVGDHPGVAFRDEIRRRGWGVMSITGRPTPGFAWAFDNGAYGWARQQVSFDASTYWRRLESAGRGDTAPDFAVIPDLPQLDAGNPYGGQESLAFSLDWLLRLPQAFRWYLAVQDGMAPEDVSEAVKERPIAGLFLGGSNDFKRTARQWAILAHEHDVAFHYARASTKKRIREAISSGADSCDSSQMLRRHSEFRRATQAYYGGMSQRSLDL